MVIVTCRDIFYLFYTILFKTKTAKGVKMKQETLAIHHGYDQEGFGAMAVPLYQTTAYDFKTAKTAADRFALKELGPIYTRLNNPTTEILESRISAVEKGAAAIATASGQAAIFYAVSNLAEAGDNIIVAEKIYGGATTLLTHTMKRFGITAKIFDSDNADDLEGLIDDKTKAIFFESLSNPQIAISNTEKITKIANRYHVVTICDNTIATPILFNPLIKGADVVVHSASKYITGQGLAIGGLIIEREDLNEKLIGNERYPQFNEPDESYHGLVYADLPFPIFTLRVRLSLMRDIGAVAAPFNSWLFIQGLETLSLRMKQHSESALKVAQFLESHPKVQKINYPGLKNDSFYKIAQKEFKNGYASGLLSFEVGDFKTAEHILNNTKLFSVVVNIGDSKSIITHPASTTHMQVPPKDLEKSGVTPGLVRLSIGLEDVDDLIDDLKQVLA